MIFEKIKKIFSEKLSISKENIMLSTRMKEDLGLDSFDAVELIIELENIFNLKIEDEKIQQCKNIKDIVEYIEIKIQEKKK
ncbi:MAG: acyl carrier protein [Candidatus Phytoplasma cynodontis]|uniref:acyl carrier protein n=1 Tax='Cynodon dactylon' phytoplasma TaxID=295320 RepID=UPI00186AF47A|nr:acyl carrier protein ['Cynodon dactylon' phytoplasma]WIA07900.1 MAG: acyl carrier protein [Candidatus Phytoplasma cynodontis]